MNDGAYVVEGRTFYNWTLAAVFAQHLADDCRRVIIINDGRGRKVESVLPNRKEAP